MDRARATSRRYNTSIHFVENSDLRLDSENRFSGRMTFRITPDRWVPADGQTSLLTLSFEGQIETSEDEQSLLVRGTYSGTYDGHDISGNLGGGVGPTESNWESKVQRARAKTPASGLVPFPARLLRPLRVTGVEGNGLIEKYWPGLRDSLKDGVLAAQISLPRNLPLRLFVIALGNFEGLAPSENRNLTGT